MQVVSNCAAAGSVEWPEVVLQAQNRASMCSESSAEHSGSQPGCGGGWLGGLYRTLGRVGRLALARTRRSVTQVGGHGGVVSGVEDKGDDAASRT